MSDAPEELWNVLAAYVEAERIELDDLEVLGGGGRRIVRVTVDHPDGVDLDTIGDLTRGISRLLDEHTSFSDPYTLEVSSPGLERKLRRPQHFQKSIGRPVTVKTRSEVDGQRRHDGTLVAADERSFTITVGDTRRVIDYGDVTSGRTVYEWKAPTKPGKK